MLSRKLLFYKGCQHEIVIQTDPKNCEYLVISGAQKKVEEFDTEDAETMMVLPVDEQRSKLADPFYRLEHEEEDLKKKKEAEPLLVRLQRVSDARHFDDYSINKSLRPKLRVLKRKELLKKRWLQGRWDLGYEASEEEDTAAAKCVQFSSNFSKNRDEKRALIKSMSIFSDSACLNSKRLELEAKRRRINAVTSKLLAGGFKPSSWSKVARHKKC
ncbi:putative saf4/Yju2 protein [Helianthus annuus]|nr:putative saf4/Yju2 protein [Helianthus annuus]KAJ0447574.1 putative saf4/Yju2 protein [Helianthus annuus]KAJ0632481.1 putative saf4/Yju2 protein [Helianthus annuus]KAJ0636322.1 putative saf4/Yju2 protein [Helianthus annuus]KAJ0826360.1 putative saf4/Yju2 protein [Helianthus annuus]